MASKRIVTEKSLIALWKAIVDQLEPKYIGKHLSENDLTDELKKKIENIPNEIRNQVTGVFRCQGSTKYVNLPKSLTNKEAGYVYNVTNQFISNESFIEEERFKAFPPGTNVIWTGSEWDVLSGVFDFENFKKISETENFSLEELIEITSKTEFEHEHKFWDRIIKPPTCKDDGIKRWSCIYNDEYYDEVIPATGIHTYDEVVTKEATHLEEGLKTFTCSGCNISYTEIIPKIVEHTHISFIEKQPTCIELGSMGYLCECGDYYNTPIPYIDHDYVDNICTVCGKHQYEDFTLNISNSFMAGIDDLTGDTIIPETFEYENNLYQVVRVVYPNGIKSISHEVASNNKRLVSVALPSSITEISEKAFYNCPNLEKIEMGQNVITIGNSAFEECTKLNTLSNYQYYEEFIGADGITYNTVPEATNNIGENAFKGCISLTPFYVHSNIRNIGENAFLSIPKLAIDRKSALLGAPWGAIEMEVISINS